MNLIYRISLFIFFTSMLFSSNKCCSYEKCEGYKTKISKEESEFKFDNNNYRLIVDVFHTYNDFHIAHDLFITYRVYKNNKLLNDIVKDDNTIKGDCDNLNGGEYSIELIKDENKYIGWIIYSPYYCGATSSADWGTIIIPSKNENNYVKSKTKIWSNSFQSSKTTNGLNFYYSKQSWNQGGTWSSIFIPLKLHYDQKNNVIFSKNIEIEDLNFLKNKSFLGLFMSGFESYNIDLMDYAVKNYFSDKELDWYESYFGTRHRSHTSIVDIKNKEIILHDCSKNSFLKIINDLKNNLD